MADLRPSVFDAYRVMAALRWYGPQFAKSRSVLCATHGSLEARSQLTTAE